MNEDRIWILMARKRSGEATPEELDELRLLLGTDSASGYANEIMDKVWDAPLETIPESNVPDRVWEKIHANTAATPQAPVRDMRRKWFFAAACAILAFSVATVLYYNRPRDEERDGVAQGHVNQVSTQAGSRSRLELPDGTHVWLNGSSTITYSGGAFGKKEREVRLSGEAFFDVVKNEKVPFVIHTGAVNITVKGTAFNVKAYPKEKTVETALVRGLVEITTERDPDRKILLKPNEKIIIPVTTALSLREKTLSTDTAHSELYSITKLSGSGVTPQEIEWMSPKLSFDNEPFSVLAPRMENWYHVRIHFGDARIAARRFSGVIENESISETLKAMQLSYPFHFEIKDNDLWIGEK